MLAAEDATSPAGRDAAAAAPVAPGARKRLSAIGSAPAGVFSRVVFETPLFPQRARSRASSPLSLQHQRVLQRILPTRHPFCLSSRADARAGAEARDRADVGGRGRDRRQRRGCDPGRGAHSRASLRRWETEERPVLFAVVGVNDVVVVFFFAAASGWRRRKTKSRASSSARSSKVTNARSSVLQHPQEKNV